MPQRKGSTAPPITSPLAKSAVAQTQAVVKAPAHGQPEERAGKDRPIRGRVQLQGTGLNYTAQLCLQSLKTPVRRRVQPQPRTPAAAPQAPARGPRVQGLGEALYEAAAPQQRPPREICSPVGSRVLTSYVWELLKLSWAREEW